MLINETKIEEILKFLLQKNLKFFIKSKQLKKGKLILFKQNNYHLELMMDINGEQKKFEIPIPYDAEVWEDDNLVYFDYRLTTLAKNNPKLQKLIMSVPKDGNSKFYDTILEIEIED